MDYECNLLGGIEDVKGIDGATKQHKAVIRYSGCET